METDYLTPSQAAKYLKVSSSTLAKRRLYGEGPQFTRIGRSVRYRRGDLDAFMAAAVGTSTSDDRSGGDE
jgi:excisionase family DNA binding protein